MRASPWCTCTPLQGAPLPARRRRKLPGDRDEAEAQQQQQQHGPGGQRLQLSDLRASASSLPPPALQVALSPAA